MKKTALIACAASLSFLAAGCQQDTQLKQASNEFFEAFNHLCEADTLSVTGEADVQGIEADFTLELDSKKQQAALQASIGDGPIAFYIRDGKTYLNYLGTKSASLASNIGIEENTPLRIPNPFLELDEKERLDVFKSVSVEGNEYSFVLNSRSVAAFLDDYGAAKVDSASLDAVIENGQLSSLELDIEGQYDIGTASAPLDLSLNAESIIVDQPLTIEFPADLDTWSNGR